MTILLDGALFFGLYIYYTAHLFSVIAHPKNIHAEEKFQRYNPPFNNDLGRKSQRMHNSCI